VRLWDAVDGTPLARYSGHRGGVTSVTFSPQGTQLLSGSSDKTLRVWDAATGREVRCMCGHVGSVASVAWSADGDLLASASDDQTVRVWDAQRGSQCGLQACASPVRTVVFCPGRRQLCGGLADGSVQIWNTAYEAAWMILKDHKDTLSSVGCSCDGGQIATGSYDTTVRIWDVATGRQIRCLLGHADGVRNVAYGEKDGRPVLRSASDTTVRIWDAATYECLDVVPTPAPHIAVPDMSLDAKWQAMTRGLDTVVEVAATRQPVAWFPVRRGWLVCHPVERTWAWAAENSHHLYLVTVEGKLDSPPSKLS
jgi:WD40 repeat protein